MVEYVCALKIDEEDKPSFGQNAATVTAAFLPLESQSSLRGWVSHYPEKCGKHGINTLHMLGEIRICFLVPATALRQGFWEGFSLSCSTGVSCPLQ